MANPQINEVSNPQAIQGLNANWVNGIAPGYAPTAGAGLTLNLGPGSAFSGTAMISYAGGTLTMANNTTNYVFLDSAASYAPASNTTGFTATTVPIATVVTSGGAITGITDDRLANTVSGGGGGGGLNGAVVKTTSYTAVSGDNGKQIVFDSPSAVTLTLPPAPPTATWGISVENIGAGALTVSGNGLNIDGSSSNLILNTNQGVFITTDNTNYFTERGFAATSSLPTIIGFIINNGAVGNNVGPMLLAAKTGSVTKLEIVVKSSDVAIGLSFRIMKNGVNVFVSNPTVAAGTAPGTISSSTSLTSNPLSVAFNDMFQIDILSGSPAWAFTAQLET